MKNYDSDSFTSDKDTNGTDSLDVSVRHSEEPGVNVEDGVKTDVSFKVCNVDSFAVSNSDNPY